MWLVIDKTQKALLLLRLNPGFLLRVVICKFIFLLKSPLHRNLRGVIFECGLNCKDVKKMYIGTYELRTQVTLRKFLKKGDVFIDVGANIGFITAIAAGLCGKTGEVHSFEPVPQYYYFLAKLAQMNRPYHITVNQAAIGETEGQASIVVTGPRDIGWNSMVPGYASGDTIMVPVKRIDAYTIQKSLRMIAVIKIDTEGSEFSVLKSLSGYFDRYQYRPVIICEITPNPSYSVFELVNYMRKYGYRAFSINNPNREVDITGLINITVVLFIAK